MLQEREGGFFVKGILKEGIILKSGIVTLVGKPNTGKSSLINAIFEQKVVIVSEKPQTTWHQIRCIYTDALSQIVFTDTPGINKPSGPIGKYMVKAVRNALDGIDVILWVFDAERGVTKAEQYVYEKLQSIDRPIFAVVNKIDKANGTEIKKVIEQIQRYAPYQRIIKTSAKRKEGITELVDSVREFLNEGPFLYDPETLIDKPIRFIVSELIREKIYRYTSQEIPYETGVYIEFLSEKNPGLLEIRAEILVNRDTQKGILIGKNAEMIQKIRLSAKKDIAYMFDKKTRLDLYVRVKENWTRDETLQTKELDFDALIHKKRGT